MGAYRYCTGATGGVPGVHREGPPLSEGHMGRKGQGTSPWRARRAPHLGPMRLGLGGNPKGEGLHLTWGASHLPLGRRPPSRSHLEGAGPLPPSPINRGVRGGLQHDIQGAAPPLPNTSPPPCALGEALPENCHSTTTTPSCCCWSLLPQPLPPPCWIKAWETSPLRTCVEHGGAVRSALGSSVIWITTSTTPSTPFS